MLVQKHNLMFSLYQIHETWLIQTESNQVFTFFLKISDRSLIFSDPKRFPRDEECFVNTKQTTQHTTPYKITTVKLNGLYHNGNKF